MKNIRLFSVLLLMLAGIFSCADGNRDESETLARIDGYRLTVEAFDRHIAGDLELDESFKVTEQAKREMLQSLIRKQILIQEAKRRQLDTKEDFVETIQRYWESTLIRNLLDLKGKEIDARIYVSQEEIKSRYEEIKLQQPSIPPLEDVSDDIEEDLKEEKKTGLLEAWIEDLQKKADVEINDELL